MIGSERKLCIGLFMAINNVVIRVDASAVIGSGHVMRCLTLADRFKTVGILVIFVCREFPNNMIQLIEKRGYRCLKLSFGTPDEYLNQQSSDDYSKWLWVTQQQDAEETLAVLNESEVKPDLLVVDHYGLGCDWEKTLQDVAGKILVVDDIARKHECDYLLDQNYYADANQRYLNKVPSTCKLFLGSEYFLFSSDMLEQAKNIRQRTELKKVFVFFGGADPKNYTLQVLQVAPLLPDLEFHVVVGVSNPNYLEVAQFCKQQNNCVLHYNIDYMPRLINECDLGICAGGVNTWERILLQLPSIVYAVADNQVEICNSLKLINRVEVVNSLHINRLKSLLDDYKTQKFYLGKFFNFESDVLHVRNIVDVLRDEIV